MFGIPIDLPTNAFCGNKKAVRKNAICLELPLKKEHNMIAYHQTLEAVAAGIIQGTKEAGWKEQYGKCAHKTSAASVSFI